MPTPEPCYAFSSQQFRCFFATQKLTFPPATQRGLRVPTDNCCPRSANHSYCTSTLLKHFSLRHPCSPPACSHPHLRGPPPLGHSPTFPPPHLVVGVRHPQEVVKALVDGQEGATSAQAEVPFANDGCGITFGLQHLCNGDLRQRKASPGVRVKHTGVNPGAHLEAAGQQGGPAGGKAGIHTVLHQPGIDRPNRAAGRSNCE